MIRFTKDEISSFQSRKDKDGIMSLLKEKASAFSCHKLNIPEKGIADWSHYYYCPDCSVMLVFDPESPSDHVCPKCGKHFSDEKKNGAWWRLMNSYNEERANINAEIYLLSGNKGSLNEVVSIIKGYAKYYPDYKEHGNIPYNGPGKLNAQTLDEANFLRNLAYAYDLVSDSINEEDKEYIESRLFRVGIEFLKRNRHSQIHNHEVICNGAIGVLALILDDKESLDFALYGKYGLKYQLSHGILDDGFWFECSTAYHFYAFQNFMLYEKFAKNTAYSNLSDPNYRKMLLSILRLEKSDGSFPLLNDCHPNQGERDGYNLYEFAYKVWRDEDILRELNGKYTKERRLSRESFFYGVESLPEVKEQKKYKDLIGESGLGASVIRKGELYLLFRHGPYGGEHDHYDRLSFSYYFDNVPVSIDMGTTGYGALLHYDYYKNTATHNTVSIDCKNQAPSRGEILEFSEKDGRTRVKAKVDWTGSYQMPDSFTIKEWDDDAYKNARMTRLLDIGKDFIFDVFRVDLDSDGHEIFYSMHFHGTRPYLDDSVPVENPFYEKPLKHISSCKKATECKFHSSYSNSGISTDVYSFVPNGEILLATGPDNPSSSSMSYIIGKRCGRSAVFASVIASAHNKSHVENVTFSLEGGKISASVELDRKEKIVISE